LSVDKPEPGAVLRRLLQEYRTGSLATVSPGGLPQASYVPFAVDGSERFLFFVSDLSEHTENLRRSGRAALMLIEDESRSQQLFARNRATFAGSVRSIPRDSAEWPQASRLYGDRFGKLFEMLAGLKDFHMFALHPEEIRLVVGFGGAYQVSGPGWERLKLLKGR
jgi:putative heme iron utilization protein